MGIFDEFKRLARPYEDEENDGFDDDFEVAPRPAERRERPARSENVFAPSLAEEERRSNKVVNIRAATQLQVVLVKPEKFDDASAIADHLRELKFSVSQISYKLSSNPFGRIFKINPECNYFSSLLYMTLP